MYSGHFRIASFKEEDAVRNAWAKCNYAVCIFKLENNRTSLQDSWGINQLAVDSIKRYAELRIPRNMAFIGYKNVDMAAAKELHQQLVENLGIDVFLDNKVLNISEDISTLTEHVLRSQVYFPLISPDAILSAIKRTTEPALDYFLFEIILVLGSWKLRKKYFMVCQLFAPIFVNGYFRPYDYFDNLRVTNDGLKETIQRARKEWQLFMEKYFGENNEIPSFPFDDEITFKEIFDELWGINGFQQFDVQEISDWLEKEIIMR
jgi:hypothetical protein